MTRGGREVSSRFGGPTSRFRGLTLRFGEKTSRFGEKTSRFGEKTSRFGEKTSGVESFWRGVLSFRRGLALSFVLALVGCGCSTDGSFSCSHIACIRRTEVFFVTPIVEPGSYSLEVVPLPDGRRARCAFQIDASGTLTESSCDVSPGAALMTSLEADAAMGLGTPGVALVGHAQGASLRIERAGSVIYEGNAELESVRNSTPHACEPDNCLVPILQAR